MFGKNTKRAYPQKIYLNNPKMYSGGMTKNICRNLLLDVNDLEYKNTICAVFPVDINKYNGKNIIYLTQPLYTIQGYNKDSEKKNQEILNHIMSLNRYVLRPHPVDSNKFDKENDNVDLCGNIWELLCEKAINNKSILIGYYTTAQFIPFILYQKEPYIIFLYRLFPELDSCGYNEKTVNFLKSHYRDNGKILIPSTIEEMVSMIGGLNND